MKGRWASVLAWVMWLTAVLFLAGYLMYVAGQSATIRAEIIIDDFAPASLISLALVTVGSVVSSRRSSNPIGWILLGSGWLFALNLLLYVIARAGVAGVADPQLGRWALWAAPLTFFPAFMTLLLFLPLLFPDGRLLSPRWRVVAWLAVAGIAAETLSEVFRPGQLSDNYPGVNNPLPFTAPEWLVSGVEDLLGPVLFAPLLIAAGASVVLRYRRSRGVARQQYKWVAFPAALFLIFIPLNESGLRDASGVVAGILGVMFMVGLGGLPVGVGIAVLRYRLYDIDRLISRTVTYALVVGMLAAVLASVAIGIPRLLGLTEGSPLLVAAATLAVAALFNPLRRRIQARVDRRFNRARYDAQQEVDRLAERLRTELELEDLTGEVMAVVGKTMEPASASVWIKEQLP